MNVVIRFTAKDMVDAIPKFKTHYDWIASLFAEKGFTLINHKKIKWMRADSDSVLIYEGVGIIGESIADSAAYGAYDPDKYAESHGLVRPDARPARKAWDHGPDNL